MLFNQLTWVLFPLTPICISDTGREMKEKSSFLLWGWRGGYICIKS